MITKNKIIELLRWKTSPENVHFTELDYGDKPTWEKINVNNFVCEQMSKGNKCVIHGTKGHIIKKNGNIIIGLSGVYIYDNDCKKDPMDPLNIESFSIKNQLYFEDAGEGDALCIFCYDSGVICFCNCNKPCSCSEDNCKRYLARVLTKEDIGKIGIEVCTA